MSEMSDLLKQQYQDNLSGDKPSCTIAELGKKKIFWNPLTGSTQKLIQEMATKSTAEGICMHVKLRAIDDKGQLIFKENSVLDMMTNYNFETISKIFFHITKLDISDEDLEKN